MWQALFAAHVGEVFFEESRQALRAEHARTQVLEARLAQAIELTAGIGKHKRYCLLLQDLYKSCARGGGVKRGDVCYGMLRAAACVDESDHHALMYVWHGQIVREDRVGEASARRP